MKMISLKRNTRDSNLLVFIINVVIIFFLIYCVAFQVPVHSDDYSYYLYGLSLRTHVNHYLNWSGRFIVDYVSSFLLNSFPRPIYMAINSMVLIILVVTITILPNLIKEEKWINKRSSVVLWVSFLLYWVANPNLGQTSFWLVGSVNYLWTLMWASVYFNHFLYLMNTEKKRGLKQLILLFFLGFVAGLSNEGLGVTVVLFSGIMLFVYWKKKNVCFIGLVSTIFGYLFLFFAPGNYARMNADMFSEWRELPVFEKLLKHFLSRLPSTFGSFYLVYFLLIIMLIMMLLFCQRKNVKNISISFSLIFIALAICSVLAFAVSPAMPWRSVNTCLFYLLLAVSVIANELATTDEKWSYITLSGVLLVCGLYFALSYSFILHAYKQTKDQANIREGIIEEAKMSGNTSAKIPDWYFTRLSKDTDKFDIFRSGAMPRYYGLTSIEYAEPTFNYAVINNTRPLQINENLKEGLVLCNVFMKFSSPFEQTIVFEFSDLLTKYTEEGDQYLYIHLFLDDRAEFINADLKLTDFLKIDDKYYYGRTFSTPQLDSLYFINYGFYNPDTKTNSAEYSIDIKELKQK